MFAGSEPSVVKNYLLVWRESHSAGRFLHVLAAEMKHPLSRFAPSPSLYALRATGGGRSQCGGAALARLPWLGPRPFHALRVARSAMDN